MLTIISGSSRKESESLRISRYLKDRSCALDVDKDVNIISLENSPIPLWSETYDQKFQEEGVDQYLRTLELSDSIIIVAPEWNGSTCPDLLNFMHYWKPQHLAHKPALIVAVSSGLGGAYTVTQIKSFTTKNNSLVYIPNHIIVRNSNRQFSIDVECDPKDNKLAGRIDHSLHVLSQYSVHLKNMKCSWSIDGNRYGFGM